MNDYSRRDAFRKAAAAGAAAIGAPAVLAAADDKPKANKEEQVHSQAEADSHGPRELFAVVDADGKLMRGLHAAGAKRLDVGTYEVTFKRDVRKGAYFATIGGHGYYGTPQTGQISVMGRANSPRAILVTTCDGKGDPVNAGFHLLVVCPDGYA